MLPLLPEALAAGTLVLLLVAGAAGLGAPRGVAARLALVGLTAVVVALGAVGTGPSVPVLGGAVQADALGTFCKLVCTLATLIVIGMSEGSAELRGRSEVEYHVLLVGSLLGMFLLCSAVDLVMLVVAFELTSLPSYVLAGYLKRDRASTEAAMKYVLYGATATACMVFGLSLLYGAAGATDLASLARSLKAGPPGAPLAKLALALLLVGFGYKVAAVPFHQWCPDVYEGAPAPVTAFLSVAPKAAGMVALLRVLYTVLPDPASGLGAVLATLAAVTMTVGNVTALQQTNVKRLLAYSSVAHAGYMLMAAACVSADGVRAVLLYLAVYLFMNLGAFYVVILVANATGREDLGAYRGLARRATFPAVAMAAFLFSLTGIPPFAGFVGKVYVFAEVIARERYWLAVVGALNGVVAFAYYARLVRAMFLEAPADATPLTLPEGSAALLGALLAPTLVLGLYWEPLARLADQAARSLPF